MKKISLLFLFVNLIFLFSCSKENEPLAIETAAFDVVSGEEVQIKLNGEISGCSFVSGNSNIATVTSDGLVTAKRVGKTFILVVNAEESLNSKCEITVKPKYEMYSEPYLNFGVAVEEVKSFEKRTLKSESIDGLVYDGDNSMIQSVAYTVENELCTSAAVVVNINSFDLLSLFLEERYIVPKSGPDIIFTTIDKKVAGGITTITISGETYYLVAYFPNPATKTNMIEQFQSVANKYKANIQ